jgi:two-component sensor histidine kinase
MGFPGLFSRFIVGLLMTCYAGVVGAQTYEPAPSLTQVLAQEASENARMHQLLQLAGTYRNGEVIRQFQYASTALQMATQTANRWGIMQAEEALGNCYIKVLNYGEALLHLKKALSISIQLHDATLLHRSLQQLAQSYQSLGQLEQASECHRWLVRLAVQRGDPYNHYRQLRAYARSLAAQGRYNEAIRYLHQDVQLVSRNFNGMQRDAIVAELYNVIATIYNTVYDQKNTLLALKQASTLIRHTDSASTAAYILSTYCDMYYTHRQYDSAAYYGEETIRRAIAARNIDMQRYYSDLLSKIYTRTGQPDAALAYHLKFDSLKEVQFNTQKAFTEGHELMKLNMEQQGVLSALEKRGLDTARRNQQNLLVMAGVIVLVLLVLTVIIYRNLRQNQRTNRIIGRQAADLKHQNQVIDEALKAKELMLKETHHRIKNNLQLISSLLELQVAELPDEPIRAALRNAQRRIQSIATVHNKLYGSGAADQVELSAFTDELFARLSQAFGDTELEVRFENAIPETVLPLHTVVILGLVLNELITNAFKHAFATVVMPQVTISLQPERDQYRLMYHDNGPGLPSGIVESPSGSIGLYLIRRLTTQLGGTVTYTFQEGAIFTLVFPYARK